MIMQSFCIGSELLNLFLTLKVVFSIDNAIIKIFNEYSLNCIYR